MIGPNPELGPWVENQGPTAPNARAARLEQQRNSFFRVMFFMLFLILMDGEEQNQRRRHDGLSALRKKSKTKKDTHLELSLFDERIEEDKHIQNTIQKHDRYKYLVEKNEGKDIELEVRTWAEAQLELEKDEFAQTEEKEIDPDAERKVFYYPWNATGFYRGEWNRNVIEVKKEGKTFVETETNVKRDRLLTDAVDNEDAMLKVLKERDESIGVYFLPEGIEIKMQNGSAFAETHPPQSGLLRGQSQSSGLLQEQDDTPTNKPHITLSKDSGRVAFQLYSRSVPAMKEISILDGLVKLYDSNIPKYSTRHDILLRVSGVIIHSIGRISLVSNRHPGRSAFVIKREETREIQRRLQEALNSQVTEDTMDDIRDDALRLFEVESEHQSSESIFTSAHLDAPEFTINDHQRRLLLEDINDSKTSKTIETNEDIKKTLSAQPVPSKSVFPYPFVTDDNEQSIQYTRTQAARSLPPKEQLLEKNAIGCEFEITMDVKEEEWEIRTWRAFVSKYIRNRVILDPRRKKDHGKTDNLKDTDGTEIIIGKSMSGSQAAALQQNLVLAINGTIFSPNCNFTAQVNASALRTDWEHTTEKAVNYSSCMLLTCLVQIVLLLHQILHTQAQSAATRVSILCIGWQTVLDAMSCLFHIYLSLEMKPVFSAFASVAFFKLIIFCVIELKYMALIIQARNVSGGGNTTQLLRRQVTMLHLRFYVALIGTQIVFFYAWQSYRKYYVLALYSFWIPQIIQNTITEAKRPLHRNYVYGMTLTRMVAPLFIFCVQDNFLKEVYPDAPTDPVMCQMLIIWILIQAAILEAQGRYGARFMIPARFLPPKFDYNRPIPASMLPPKDKLSSPSESMKNDRGPTPEVRSLMPRDSSPHMASGGARNRIKGNRANRNEVCMTSETTMEICQNSSSPKFDCVICYNKINSENRKGYMLAPCEHIFHKDCLVQWMEVKMECPICRTRLPEL